MDETPPIETPADPPPDAPPETPPADPPPAPEEPGAIRLKHRAFGGGGALAGAGRGAGGTFGYHHAAGSLVVSLVFGGEGWYAGSADLVLGETVEDVPLVGVFPDAGFRIDLRPNAMVSPTTVFGGCVGVVLPGGIGPCGFNQTGSTFHVSRRVAIDTVAETRIVWLAGRMTYFVSGQTGLRF